MGFKNLVEKELYVAIHAQTARFRVVKYILIFAVIGSVYAWKGSETAWWTLGIVFVVAIAMHLFFRWKSKGWNEPWGMYKPPEGMPR